MKFRKGNKIRFGQDHRWYRGIPNGVDFEVVRYGDSAYILTAHGYGMLGTADGGYGNGSLHLRKAFLRASTIRRLETAIAKRLPPGKGLITTKLSGR